MHFQPGKCSRHKVWKKVPSTWLYRHMSDTYDAAHTFSSASDAIPHETFWSLQYYRTTTFLNPQSISLRFLLGVWYTRYTLPNHRCNFFPYRLIDKQLIFFTWCVFMLLSNVSLICSKKSVSFHTWIGTYFLGWGLVYIGLKSSGFCILKGRDFLHCPCLECIFALISLCFRFRFVLISTAQENISVSKLLIC